MKVLHLWRSESSQFGGGGAVAMSSLHSALRTAGLDSQILCRFKATDLAEVHAFQPNLGFKIIEKLLQQVTSNLGLNDLHRVSSFTVKQHQAYKDADAIHFHGTHSFLNFLALPALTVNKSVVFTLHDLWMMTGHCSYMYDCDRWLTGCGKCPYPNTAPAIKRDGTHLEWRLKDWVYRQLDLTIVTPSRWLADRAKQSPLLNRFPIHQIPYGIDTESLHALDPAQCRAQLGIPLDKKVLMFAAVDLQDRRKGGDLLVQALSNLPASLKAETVLLVIGRAGKAIAQAIDLPVYDLGYLTEDCQKAVAYAAADLFVFPTRADIFGLVSIESQACGTPVVAFKVGAVPEHVLPGITGYLATPEDPQDLCAGIVQLLEDEPLRQTMRQQCRAIAQEQYNLKRYAQNHINLYRSLCVKSMTYAIDPPTELKRGL